MPSHVKTYDGSGDPKDHIKLLQSTTKIERWAMPTWCHMFNSTLTRNARIWFDKLPKESIDSYEDLRATLRENYLQQTKHIKDPVEIHHIKQRSDRKPDRFSLLTKTPKEIFALEKGKFKAPPPMVTPAEKRDPKKYCEFHTDTGHNTDECMQLRKQIEEMIKSGKLSQIIKELK
ncbi:reverse transcriptase domain-containing protein [Tanacetum coccineum]